MNDPARILVIDDEPALASSLADYLEDAGYDCKTAQNGREGLTVLNQWPADVVLVDLNMPVLDGYGFIELALKSWPDLPIIVVSGVGVVDQAVEALRVGAWDYVTKPVIRLSLIQSRVEKALERARLVRENREYQKNLEAKVEERTLELEETKRQLIYSLGKSAEYRDNETGSHVVRVGSVCYEMAKTLGLSEHQARMLRDAAPLHDIGKIGVPDAILLKPDRLTPEEWRIMQGHCEMGYHILQSHADVLESNVAACSLFLSQYGISDSYSMMEMARMIALCHHERFDGTGYPCGMIGESIPLEARIVSVADVYDALGSERPYKKAFEEAECQRIVRQGSGTQFDPAVIEAFFSRIEAIKAIKAMWRD